MLAQDTIVAPATASGDGAIGIVRASGPGAEACLIGLFRPSRGPGRLQSHRLYHGRAVDPDGAVVDEVMAVVLRAPRSYTREDVVEVHCHGGAVVLRRILDLFLEAGARLARPGEFTLRAFLNGRIDLTQAEAVIDVIRARSEASQRLAEQQLAGRLSGLLAALRGEVVDLLAEVEAHIDFPEDDLGELAVQRLHALGDGLLGQVGELLATFDGGRILHEGLRIVILGRPNVGKSSLLNALLGEARAIVTDIPGTTRDTIEEDLDLGGVPVRVIDTAGIRSTADPIEAEGVRRSQEQVAAADLILLVVDGSRPLQEEDRLALRSAGGGKCLLVANKADLPFFSIGEPFASLPRVDVSARTGVGIDRLAAAVHDLFGPAPKAGREGALVYLRRHRQALIGARRSLERFLGDLAQGASPEFLALALREVLRAFGEITGETAPEEVLDRIFARFCIGK